MKTLKVIPACLYRLRHTSLAALSLLIMVCPSRAVDIISSFTADSTNASIGTMSLIDVYVSPGSISTLESGSNVFNTLALRADFTVIGNYTFEQLTGDDPEDTVGILYTTFDSANPQSGYITGNDDGYVGGRELKPVFTFNINAPGTRDIVISTYNGGETLGLPQDFQISGPGAVNIFAISNQPQQSAETTGLPMVDAQGQALVNGGNTVTGDVNNHLYNLRSGDGEEAASDGSIASSIDDGVVVGQGDGPEDPIARKVKRSRQWEVFTTVNYGNVKLSAVGGQAGVQVDSWAPGIGIERHLSRGLAIGFAVSFLHSEQGYTGGLGSVQLEGPALSAYISFVRKNFWTSLLYSFGTYDLNSTRNPGFAFPQAFGSTRTYTNAIQYNTGWNFRFQDNTLVTGPFAGVDYLYGAVDSYSEVGGGLAALSYAKQTYQSLVSRIGWSVSKKLKSRIGAITPQARLSYERQNLKNNGSSVSLINAPFTATGGNQQPGQDYVVAGAGVNFQLTDQFNLMLSYQGQFFRENMQAHFGALRFSYSF